MGARQSKRSVDITTTPKKCEGEAAGEGEGKVEKIGDVDVTVTNGSVHKEIEFADKEENEAHEPEKEDIKENGVSEPEESKTPEKTTPLSAGDQVNETPVEEKSQENSEKIEETAQECKKVKEKSKKKKWSFRSISFSKKDKSKPNKESDKNGEVKEVAEENAEENAATPSVETPKTEEQKQPESAVEPVTNGEAAPEELSKPTEEPPKPAEEAQKLTEETKAPEPAKETPVESTPTPIKEEEKLPIKEPAPPAESPKIEEPKPVEVETPAVVEESKEVRNEEVPPPLPSSNPPSSVSVFAESTKADALPVGQVPQDPSPVTVPTVETFPEPLVTETVETLPPAASSPVVDNVPEMAPIVETTVETVSADSVVCEKPAPEKVEEQITVAPHTETLPSTDTTDIPSVEQKTEFVEQKTESLEPQVDVVKSEPPVVEPVNPEPVTTSPIAEPAKPEPVAAESEKSSVIENDVKQSSEATKSETEVSPVITLESTQNAADNPKKVPVPVNESVSEKQSDVSVKNVVDEIPAENLDRLPSFPEIAESQDEQSSPSKDAIANESSLPEPISVSSEPVANADSLPDISTESLPSLPEPTSENLPEPLSLPPLDLVPNPIATDVLPEPPTPEASTEASEKSLSTNEIALTNGTTNGLNSPVNDDVISQAKAGPLKQVPSDLTESNEVRQESGDIPKEVSAEPPAAVATE